jgi:hypothetical protein
MIAPHVAQAGIKAAVSMESGLADLADLAEAMVGEISDERDSSIKSASQVQNREWIYKLAQVVRAVAKTQRTQAKYLRLVLEGYVEPEPPIIVQPQHGEPGVGGAPVKTGPAPLNGSTPPPPPPVGPGAPPGEQTF